MKSWWPFSFWVLTLAACKGQSLGDRSNFVADGMEIQARDEYSGEPMTVDNSGVTTTGGLSVASEGGRTRVRSVARMLVNTATDQKPVADDAITRVTGTYSVTTTYPLVDFGNPKVTAVTCGQVMSTSGDPAGCDALDVTLPEGTALQPLTLAVTSGIGAAMMSLTGVLANVSLHASHGALDVTVPASPGAVIEIVADTGDAITIHLARDFATEALTLDTQGAIDTSAFPDVMTGQARGALGAGAKSITARSMGAGAIVLKVQ